MFKELLLDNSKIEKVINDYFNEKYSNVSVIPNNNEKVKGFTEIRYNVQYDDEKLFLTVYINSKGKTTLKVKEGKHQDEKEKLAEYIKENCKLGDNSKNNKGILFSDIEQESFSNTLDLIREEELCTNIIVKKDDDKESIYQLKGKYNDLVTVTYKKTTSNIYIQGIPLLLYELCVSYFNQLLGVDDVVKNLEDNYKQNVSTTKVEEQYKLYLPNSYDKQTDKLKKSLLKAVYNLNVTSQEFTCTELVFEALRALEGHIKITLYRDYQIKSSNVYGNLDMFGYDYDNEQAYVKKRTKNKIIKIKDRVSYYEKAYKHIVIYRHKYFHWDYPNDFGKDETKQIDDIDEAKNLIKSTLEIIDEYYTI